VAVKIRLKRIGKIHAPYYRIVVADSRTKRDGRAIEEIGKYHPTEEPSLIEVDSARAQYWLGVGAQPTEAVTALLKLTGDWESFTGEKQTRTLEVAAPKRDKAEIFDEALKDLHAGEAKSDATTKKAAAKKADKKAEEPKADKADKKAEEPKADKADKKAEEPKADKAEKKAEEPKADKAEKKAEEPKAEEAPAAEAPAAEASEEAKA
jgi:small subunit ribosomal protein S16